MAKEPKEQGSKPASAEQKPICGIVMPISPMVDFPSTHWGDVQRILEDAITLAGFFPRIVSMSNVPTIIHKDIVHNLYSDPIVVCDVSGGNPNVMLEVGMRLAFDKPTIIVKDEQTSFNFDTSPLRQLEYPRDLRHGRIEEFKARLAQMISATVEAAAASGYTSFLKSFGPLQVPIEPSVLDEKAVNAADYKFNRLIDEFAALRQEVRLNYQPLQVTPKSLDDIFADSRPSTRIVWRSPLNISEATRFALLIGAKGEADPSGASWTFELLRPLSASVILDYASLIRKNFQIDFYGPSGHFAYSR